MQSAYAASFSREFGCTETEWMGWLPNAIGDNPWTQDGRSVQINIAPGTLRIQWQPSTPRVIALMAMPRLVVSFDFDGLDDAQRYRFMKRFDLYMQRGGG